MPSANLLTAAVAALIDNTDAEQRVHVGSRLQSGSLPALVIEQLSAERAALTSSSTTSLVRHQWRISAVASTMIDARQLASLAATVAASNMNVEGFTTYRISEPVLEEPQSGEGDEQEPAVASLTLETLFPE